MGHTENIKLLGIFGIIDYDQLKKMNSDIK